MLAGSHRVLAVRQIGCVVAVVLLVATGCQHERQSGGPLQDSSRTRSVTSAPVKRGQFFVIGVMVPPSASRESALLESLGPADPETAQGLELRYAVVVSSRGCRVGAARNWPPLGCVTKMRAVKGFRVPGHGVAELLVGARSQRIGRWTIPAFRLHYRVGDRRYKTTYYQGMEPRVVRRLKSAEASAAFSSFRTEDGTIGCAYSRASRRLSCTRGGMFCLGFVMTATGSPREACTLDLKPVHVLNARQTWLYRGFRCYVGHSSVRCRNQIFKGFVVNQKGARRGRT
jgi:hypothetical protein